MENRLDITKRLNVEHALIHIAYQAMAGIVYGFSVYLLLQRGFSSSTAGFCMAFANMLSLLIQPFVSNFLDRTNKITVFEMMIITSILMLTLYLINCSATNASVLLVITFVLCVGIYSSLEPLFNSLCSVFQRNGINIEFGKARALGSLSYGVVCTIFGVLTNSYSYIVVMIGGCVFALLIVLICLIIRSDFNKCKLKEIKNHDQEEKTIGFKEFVANNKKYMILCLCLTGIFLGYTLVDNFTILVVENVGGNSQDMGIVLGIKAGLEAICIFFYSDIRKRFKLNTLLKFSMFSFILKALAYRLAKSTLTIYLIQIIQIFSFAIIIPAMVEYVNVNMDKMVAIRGQAFFTMTIVLGSTFSSLFGGLISDHYGVTAMVFVGFVVTVISAFGFVITLGSNKKVNNN